MNKAVFPAYAVNIVAIALLIVIGSLVFRSGLLDTDWLLALARDYAEHWWLVLILVLVQVVLYTFALSGSYAVWVTAPLYSPATATMILAIGGTLGAISAYWFSRRLTEKWIARVERSRAYRLLQGHNHFFSLFALRVLPGFPHGLINYSSGMLKTSVVHFLSATLLAFTIKFYIYSAVIHKATEAAVKEKSLDLSALVPLILLSLLSFAGVFIRHRLDSKIARTG